MSTMYELSTGAGTKWDGRNRICATRGGNVMDLNPATEALSRHVLSRALPTYNDLKLS